MFWLPSVTRPVSCGSRADFAEDHLFAAHEQLDAEDAVAAESEPRPASAMTCARSHAAGVIAIGCHDSR